MERFTTIRYPDIEDYPLTTNGNIDSDPLFTDTTAGSVIVTLEPGSPCIDSGSNAAVAADLLDLDGDADFAEPIPYDASGAARIQNATVDMGAYESP